MSKKCPATLLCDFYKISHRVQYPKGTQRIYATWTARTSRIKDIDEVVFFGLQGFIKEYLIDYFNENFFYRKEKEVVEEYVEILKYTLGEENPDVSHIVALHRLGYLPIKINALREGTVVPIRVPMMTIENTVDEFYWIVNYLETLISCSLWQPTTSATISLAYRNILDYYAFQTAGRFQDVKFCGHDFSMRGMSSLQSAQTSGAGHLLNFVGTDTIPAIHYVREYYNADISKNLIGTSIPATEHSVQCCYGQAGEMETFKRLITEVYPTGAVSIVSDTWDLWKVLTEYLPQLKDVIMSREGKLVIRPDSGDPVKIICGDPESDNPFARKGVIELLWDTFGGTLTPRGYRLLDEHIGCIYGDAITLERCEEICKRLKDKAFASTNMVFGIGSFSFQYNTRDTFGFAMKTTHAVVNGEERELFKNPITDDGTKKSQRGRILVGISDGEMVYADGLTLEREKEVEDFNMLRTVFENGHLKIDENFEDIRRRLYLKVR